MSTHKKIAQLAGVSLSTVSKALSGSAEISEATREKIIKIAEETGYFKKKSQRKLEYSKHRAVNIALICPEIISIHYSTTLTTIKNEIEKRGGNTFIYTSDFDPEKLKSIIKHIKNDNITQNLLNNMINCLESLQEQYPKNINLDKSILLFFYLTLKRYYNVFVNFFTFFSTQKL